jgi:hypothetical protein
MIHEPPFLPPVTLQFNAQCGEDMAMRKQVAHLYEKFVGLMRRRAALQRKQKRPAEAGRS